jgi:hypothetical protein
MEGVTARYRSSALDANRELLVAGSGDHPRRPPLARPMRGRIGTHDEVSRILARNESVRRRALIPHVLVNV